MPHALIALGSNLGDRAAHLRAALAALARLPHTRLIARSRWHETPPIGGPGEQGPFLNAAVLACTALEPAALLAELQHIETALGRVRTERWAARTLDLDLLLYDRAELHAPQLELPHPRMHYRHFVLRPAAEVAAWMVHPDSGWTVAKLLAALERTPREASVAATDAATAHALVEQLNAQLETADGRTAVREYAGDIASGGRGLILAVVPTGSDRRQMRRMLHLPATGPIVWLEQAGLEHMVREAHAALASAWPELAAAGADG